jgi:hypothetical protein
MKVYLTYIAADGSPRTFVIRNEDGSVNATKAFWEQKQSVATAKLTFVGAQGEADRVYLIPIEFLANVMAQMFDLGLDTAKSTASLMENVKAIESIRTGQNGEPVEEEAPDMTESDRKYWNGLLNFLD